MLTGTVEASIGRTATGHRNAIYNRDDILVTLGIGVTLVTNEKITPTEGDIECFVLGSLCDSRTEFEVF